MDMSAAKYLRRRHCVRERWEQVCAPVCHGLCAMPERCSPGGFGECQPVGEKMDVASVTSSSQTRLQIPAGRLRRQHLGDSPPSPLLPRQALAILARSSLTAKSVSFLRVQGECAKHLPRGPAGRERPGVPAGHGMNPTVMCSRS